MIKSLLKNIDRKAFNIFNSPAIHLDRKLYDPNFTQSEKVQLRTIMRLVLNEYLIAFFVWKPETEVREAIAKIEHQVFIDRRLPLADYVGKYFIPLMKRSEQFQHLVERTDLRKLPKRSVGDLLQLEVPIKDHLVFHDQQDAKDTDAEGKDPGREDGSARNDGDLKPADLSKQANDLNEFIADLAGLNKTERERFVSGHRGQVMDRRSAEKVFGKQIQSAKLDKINYAKGLLELTDGNRQITSDLFQLPNMKSLKDLAQNQQLDWSAVVKKTEDTELTGEKLGKTLAEAYPTAYVTERVKKTSADLRKFLSNNPTVDILSAKMGSSSIEQYAWKDIPKNRQEEVIREIRGYQLTRFLAADIRQVPILINAGFTSAQQVVGANRQAFYKQSGLPLKDARLVYKRAQEINNETLAALNLHLEQLRNQSIPFINTTQKAAGEEDTDYREIFGSLNFCDCEHCNSVLSPAAYFVDLLNFIKTNSNVALEELKRRRSDLWDIKLNCDQTNTTQPYLELILEVLSNYVVAETSKLPNAPDNIEDILYMPWGNPELPFEPEFLKAGRLAEQLDTSLFELYRLMEVDPVVLMAEYLGLGPETLKWVITGQLLPNTSPEIYPAKQFANLFNLTFDELKSLAESNIGQHIELHAIKIDIQSYEEQVKIDLSTSKKRADYLKKVFTFLRIYRHLDYSLEDLDFYLDLAFISKKEYDAVHLANFSTLMYVKDTFELDQDDLRVFVQGYEEDELELEGILEKNDQVTLSQVLFLLGIGQEDFDRLLTAFEEDLEFDGDDLVLKSPNLSLLKRNVYWAGGANMSIKEWLLFLELYQLKSAVLKNQWQALSAVVIQHEQIGVPVQLTQFYLEGKENEEWSYQITEQSLTDWLDSLHTNGTVFTDLTDWSIHLAGLLSAEDQMVELLFERLVIALDPAQGEDKFIGMVNQLISVPVDPSESGFVDTLNTFRYLDKHLQLLAFWEISAEALDFFLDHTAHFNIKVSKPQELLTGIYHFSRWMDQLNGDLELFQLLAVDGLESRSLPDDTTSAVQEFFVLEAVTLEKLLALFPGNPSPLEKWNVFFNAVSICTDLHWTPEQLQVLVETDSIGATPRQYYGQLISFFEQSVELSGFSEDKKQEITDAVHDNILETQRDALIALLKKSLTVDFSSTAKIYEYFLLDVETSACADVSPIKAAILSVQLFIQRCLMNLEENAQGNKIQFDDDDKKEWEWRKNYRVWEANRKIFLYPENYVDPNLRDDKTPIYEELERDIQQRDLTLQGIEQTYRRYLKEFSTVAKLAMTGSFYDAEGGLYYYFGRTASIPYKYYYRTYNRSIRAWSPWCEIDVKVESDYLTGTVANGRFYIFWKTTEKYIITEVEGGTATTSNGYKHMINYAYLQEDLSWSKPIKIDADIKATIEAINIWELLTGTFDWSNFSPDDYQHDNYLYVEKASTHANALRVRLSDEIAIDPKHDHTQETDVIINYYEDKWVEKFDMGNGLDSKFYLVSTKAGIQGVDPNYQTSEHRWNFTEHYRMNRRSGITHIHKWDSMTDFGEYLTAGDNVGLSIINGTYGSNFIVKNEEKHYQLLFGNGGLYALNSYVVNKLSETIFTSGIDSFLSPDTQINNKETTSLEIGDHPFAPNTIYLPEEGLDFDGPNGIYFRELYFHIPFTLAKHYNHHQKFEEADYWFRKIFDPTVEYETDEKYWQYIPFRKKLDEQLRNVLQDTAALDQYHKDPFNPHAIARLRTSSYPKAVFMAYVDNLLDWADHLFRKDTYESINEAMMLYIMAQQLLGDRPRSLAACESANENATFATVEEDLAGNNELLIGVEIYVTDQKLFDPNVLKGLEKTIADNNIKGAADIQHKLVEGVSMEVKPGYADPTILSSITQELFCVPWNDHLLQYWDLIEDRLFKIRNCLNIDGEYRQPALFEPPIDPMLLVRARAAGISLSQLTSQEQLLPYRFTYLLEKARSFAQIVQGFGQTLLATLEKEDGEVLNELRTIHEGNILRMMTLVKEKRIEELEYNRINLEIQQEKIRNNIEHFQQLLSGEVAANFKIVDQEFKASMNLQKTANILNLIASALYLLPQLGAPTAMTYGGKQGGDSGKSGMQALVALGEYAKMAAEIAEKYQEHNIRNMNWQQQLMVNQKDLEQQENALLINELSKAVAERDLEIHEQSMEQNEEILDFYADKMTSQALYNTLNGHLTRLFRDAYGLALQSALDAQQAFRFELDDAVAAFIAYDNWDTASMGLLSTEKLLYQLMQMESAYLERNTRKAEIRAHVSLAMLDPEALLDLKSGGSCTVVIPETWFDIQYPGQYKRRIKSVRITIPCVVGPFVNVACKLKLNTSRIRVEKDLDETSMVVVSIPEHNDRIFTSTAQNDSGLLEFSFRDERYLPFEGAGVDSEWNLRLPQRLRSFNYGSINDVIFHISYTAEYDELFATEVEDAIEEQINTLNENGGLVRVFSLRHEFPNDWFQAKETDGNMAIIIQQEHFPYFLNNSEIDIQSTELIGYDRGGSALEEMAGTVNALGDLPLEINISLETTEFEKEVFLVIRYRLD